MALKSTIFKAELQISDMDRNIYGDHSFTIARHPSETDERMMVRLLAFALHADEALVFGDSIGNEDEPSLWQKDLTGQMRMKTMEILRLAGLFVVLALIATAFMPVVAFANFRKE